MLWQDEGYLLSKNNFDENSIIIQAFTLDHGKYSGIVYGGSSKKQKKYFQIGNKILLNWKSKSENKMGYFSVELIKPIAPKFFDDKKRSITILSASSILKILLPENQINKKIYNSYESFLNNLKDDDWIKLYIFWELSLINNLGFETIFGKDDKFMKINNKNYKIPSIFINKNINYNKNDVKEALIFNKALMNENFLFPNKLKLPLSRNILEKYYS
tara:strand:- start:440 stop:1087 length:648 start_codon:yes stop_codon:yes gene_type:complete